MQNSVIIKQKSVTSKVMVRLKQPPLAPNIKYSDFIDA